LRSLIESMGLNKEEFDKMMKLGMLNYLPKELGDEILQTLIGKE